MRRKGRAKALYISSYRNYKCHLFFRRLSSFFKRLYKGSYIKRSFQPPQRCRCKERFRKPCEISHGVRNLFLLHLMVSHSVQNFPSLSPIVAPPLDFACYAKLLHVGFLRLVFFLASLIGLATYCQAWQKAMKCSKTRILHVFELQLAFPWIAKNSPSFLACFNDRIATKNTKTCQKLISNPC